MMKKIISTFLFASMSLAVMAQSFNGDYQSVGVYDTWEASPFRTGALTGNVAVIENHLYSATGVNRTGHILGIQRSRYGSNTYGARIDLMAPVTIGRGGKYVHALVYTPHASKVQFVGLGKRTTNTWNETTDVEQFWSEPVSINENTWTDIVAQVYTNENNEVYSIVVVPDCASPHALSDDFVAYIDEVVVNDKSARRSYVSSEIDPKDDNTGGETGEEDDSPYKLTYPKDTTCGNAANKYLKSISLKENGGTTQTYNTTSIAHQYPPIYLDATAVTTFNVTAGKTYTASVYFNTDWLQAYAYIDYNRDGQFVPQTTEHTASGRSYLTLADGSELVTYSAYSLSYTGGNTGYWYDSNGQSLGSSWGSTPGNTTTMPSFTIPSNLQTGIYRMRYKVDWNSLDPGGNDGSDNTGNPITNGGAIVDILLNVTGVNTITVKGAELYNGRLYDQNGTEITTTAITAVCNQAYPVQMSPAAGFETKNLKAIYKANSTEWPGYLVNDTVVYTLADNIYDAANDRFTLPASVMYSAVTLFPLYTQINVKDLYDTDTEYDATANAIVHVHRTLNADVWNSLCLPFDYAIPSEWSVVEVGSTSQNGENVHINFVSVTDVMEAGKPYLVKPTESVDVLTSDGKLTTLAAAPVTVTNGVVNFVPTFTRSQVPQGGYYIGTNANKLYEASEARNMKGYRAYFTVNASGVKAVNISFDGDSTPTFIEGLSTESDKLEFFNATGVRQRDVQPGINIIRHSDGRVQKVIVR